MYSGTTLTPLSGRLLGAHQKIDRLARDALKPLLHNNAVFPQKRRILHFEGMNGPDAIKRKSPAQDEPWHYFEPFDEADTQLINLIGDHYDQLVIALKGQDEVRAAFEAAWLAHAIVDGLTPAHHFPYEEKLVELRGGEGLETRTSIRDKLVLPGQTRREQIGNNWKMWGPKGLLSTHGFFEWGVAMIIRPLTPKLTVVTEQDMQELKMHGVLELFRRKAKEVSALGMYDQFQETGWTPRLVRQVRRHLAPTIVRMVAIAWFAATIDAGLQERP